jgi:hypothetical protein
MSVQLLLELIGGIIALVCFVVAAKALIGLIRLNRAAKRRAELEAVPAREAEKGMRRAS